MGVTYISQIKLPDGQSIQQGIEVMQKKIEDVGALKAGLFSVECESFSSTNTQNTKTLHLVSNSEFPASRFASFEDGSFLITDVLLGTFLSKLRAYWQPKKGGKIMIKGQRYEFCDFIIKVGVVSVGSSSTKGIAIEVEYMPCLYPRDCWSLIAEFLTSLIDDQTLSTIPHIFLQAKATDSYSPSVTILQYIELFNAMRKTNATNNKATGRFFDY